MITLNEHYVFALHGQACLLIGITRSGPLLTEGDIIELKMVVAKWLDEHQHELDGSSLIAVAGVPDEQLAPAATELVAEFNCSVACSAKLGEPFTICRGTGPFMEGNTFPMPEPIEALPSVY